MGSHIKLVFIFLISSFASAKPLLPPERNVRDHSELNSCSVDSKVMALVMPGSLFETHMLENEGGSVCMQEGGNQTLFHPKSGYPYINVYDTDKDGTPDILAYEVIDKCKRVIGATYDYDFDGQPDRRLIYAHGNQSSKHYIWLNDRWHTVKSFGKDSKNRFVNNVLIDGKWKQLKRNTFPFEFIEE